VSRAREVVDVRAGARVRRSGSVLLFILATLCVVLGPSIASAQLNLSWVDNSGGQAGFIIQRAQGTTGAYGQIAQTPSGVTSYADATVSSGTTYCYQVAAVDSAGVSAFSNQACSGLSGGGVTITAADGGTGTGTIVSSPTGINCGTLCSATYPSGTTVTLTATPASGSAFSGWSGSYCSGTSPCSVAGAGSVTVSAMFAALGTYTLTVSKQGPGTVSSSPGGISCGSSCLASYASGSVVILTAVPGNGARFNGWTGGACNGTGTCTVMLNTAMSVTASFSKGGKK